MRPTRHVDEQAVGVVVAAEAVDESNLVAQVGLRRRHQPQATRSGQADQTEPVGVHVRLGPQGLETDADRVDLGESQTLCQHA